VRTLLDSAERHERRTAISGRKLARYNIDIAAVSETRISGESELVEVGAVWLYTLLHWSARRSAQTGKRTSLVSHLEVAPRGISPRLMTMQLKLKHGYSAVFISAYAPTLVAPDDEKEAFYESLNSAIQVRALQASTFHSR